MKTHIIAGSHQEAVEWARREQGKDPFRTALKRANKIKFWDEFTYVRKVDDLLGHPTNTPLIYVGRFWENPVYKDHYDFLKRFDTPIPVPQKLFGVDISAWANSLTTVGISSGKSTMSAQAMTQLLESMKEYTEKDVTLTQQIHDEFVFEVKDDK